MATAVGFDKDESNHTERQVLEFIKGRKSPHRKVEAEVETIWNLAVQVGCTKYTCHIKTSDQEWSRPPRGKLSNHKKPSPAGLPGTGTGTTTNIGIRIIIKKKHS